MRLCDMAEEIFASGEGLDEWFAGTLVKPRVPRTLHSYYGLVHPVRGFIDKRRAQLDRTGRPLWCCPVRIATAPEADDPREAVRWNPTVDLVVFDPQHPGDFALRLGVADWLGAVPRQDVMPDGVPVHRHPLGWLQARCRGLVMLNAEATTIRSLLIGLREIIAEDVEHGQALRAICAVPRIMPRIMVAPATAALAA